MQTITYFGHHSLDNRGGDIHSIPFTLLIPIVYDDDDHKHSGKVLWELNSWQEAKRCQPEFPFLHFICYLKCLEVETTFTEKVSGVTLQSPI